MRQRAASRPRTRTGTASEVDASGYASSVGWEGPQQVSAAHEGSAQSTGAHLGRALLAYVAVITAIITLAPFRFAAVPQHGVTDLWTPFDIVMNIVMFVPLGFLYQLTRKDGAVAPLWQALLLGALVSGAIETAQLFEAERFTSLVDLATNATGALLGAVVQRGVAARVKASNAVRSLALELPLMGLVYLLVPLAWLAGLASPDGERTWMLLGLAIVAGGVLGTVHAAYIAPVRRTSRFWLLLGAVAWCIVAFIPGGMRTPSLVLAGAGVCAGVAWLRSVSTERARTRAGADANRRFELPTVRLVLPFFAAYLALSSLWPLDAAVPAWYAGFALLPPGIDGSREHIYVALEHVAAFTLVGYVIAEFHGRALRPYRGMVARVALWGGGLSLLLEATRGWHPLYGASASMLLLTVAASVFGGWLYHLQRDHVRALAAARSGT